jgi:hypothetical protein
LKGLGVGLSSTEENLAYTKVLAEGASAAVGDIHTNALKIYTDIYSLNIPEINIPKLKEVAELTAAEVRWLTGTVPVFSE